MTSCTMQPNEWDGFVTVVSTSSLSSSCVTSIAQSCRESGLARLESLLCQNVG